jgi:uncharacterized membrane protein YcaP (DUF421 family)
MGIDWRELFVPTVSVAELVIRGSVMYLVILTLLRVFRREAGALSIPDLLVIVLVADAAQNGMAGEYLSITDGIILVVTIFSWNYVLDWLAYRFRWMHRLLHPRPLPLIEDGRVNRRNLKAEMLTVEDLRALLREQGVESVSEVRRCFIESDGQVSIIKREAGEEPPPHRRRGV